MRLRGSRARALFFTLAFLFALVALLPLRLAIEWVGLDRQGLAAREASGSAWLGLVREAQFGPARLGDVRAELHPLPFLLGRARIDLERPDSARPLDGAAVVSRRTFGIDGMSGAFDFSSDSGLPVASVDLTDVSVRFAGGACASAEGLVKANLSSDYAAALLPGGLGGNARCDGGALLLPLRSQSGLEGLEIRLREDGRYRGELTVRVADPGLGQRLAGSGFRLGAGGAYRLAFSGRF